MAVAQHTMGLYSCALEPLNANSAQSIIKKKITRIDPTKRQKIKN